MRATSIIGLACNAILALACSDESDPPPVTGGDAGTSSAGTGGAAGGGGMNAGGGSMGGSSGASGAAQGGSGTVLPPFEPVVLFSFDPGMPGTYGWFADPNTATVALVDEDRDPASSTPGALRFTAVFPPYDTLGVSAPVSALYEFGNPQMGTSTALQGGTRVHFWIRLVSPTGLATSLDFFQPFIQGGAATGYSNNFGYSTPEVLADNLWHEFILEVAGQTFMNDVWRVGVQLTPEIATANAGMTAAAADAGADAGSTDAGPDLPAPAPVTLDIDYVWVE